MVYLSQVADYTEDTTMDFSAYTTDCKAINWLIARVTVSDYSDHNGKYFVGEFKGQIPYHMKQQIVKFSGTINGEFAAKIVANETEEVSYNIQFGKDFSSNHIVKFYISYYGD